MGWSIFKSKTFWGSVILGVAQIFGDHSAHGVMNGVGTIVAGAGIRDAIYKSGPEINNNNNNNNQPPMNGFGK